MELTIEVSGEFLDYREACFERYNQHKRTDSKFLQDLDCEIVEWHMIHEAKQWKDIAGWMVDAEIDNKKVDLKFVQKYWNISPRRIVNILKQRNAIDEYHFWEWIDRPSRPLALGDVVKARRVGILSYDTVADNIWPSFKVPGGCYVDVRKLLTRPDPASLRSHGEAV